MARVRYHTEDTDHFGTCIYLILLHERGKDK